MRYRLTLIGHPKLVHVQDSVEIPLRSNVRILAALAFAHPKPVSRAEVRSMIWPQENPEVAANRMRVALNKWRAVFEGGVVESKLGLGLSSAEVDCDIWAFRARLRECQDVFDAREEARVLEEVFTPWLDHHAGFYGLPASEMHQEIASALVRLVTLHLDSEQYKAASKFGALGVRLFPRNADLWAPFLRSEILQGNSERIWKVVKSADSGELFQHPVIQGVMEWEKVHSGNSSSGVELTSIQRELAHLVVESLFETRPDLLRPLFSCPQTLSISGGHPKPMMEILQKLVVETEDKDLHWQRCMGRIAGLQAWLNDAKGVQRTVRELLPHTTEPKILRAAYSALAIAHSILREWPEAMDAIDRTMVLAEQTGDPLDVIATHGNKASFLWQMGRYEESEALFVNMKRDILAIQSPRSEFELITCLGNYVYVPLMLGDWARATEMLLESKRLRAMKGVPMGLLSPALALSLTMQGKHEGVEEILRSGLRDQFASESLRSQQCAFEFAAGVLAGRQEHALAAAVLDFVQRWRHQTNFPRSKAEIDYCKRIKLMGKDIVREPQTLNTRDPKQLAALILRQLRSSTI